MTHEIETLESNLEKTIQLASEDYSAEIAVDELTSMIKEKKAYLKSKNLGTGIKFNTSYAKELLLNNMETLKQANPDITFEMSQPENLKLSVVT